MAAVKITPRFSPAADNVPVPIRTVTPLGEVACHWTGVRDARRRQRTNRLGDAHHNRASTGSECSQTEPRRRSGAVARRCLAMRPRREQPPPAGTSPTRFLQFRLDKRFATSCANRARGRSRGPVAKRSLRLANCPPIASEADRCPGINSRNDSDGRPRISARWREQLRPGWRSVWAAVPVADCKGIRESDPRLERACRARRVHGCGRPGPAATSFLRVRAGCVGEYGDHAIHVPRHWSSLSSHALINHRRGERVQPR